MRQKNNQVGFGKSFDSYLSIVTKNGLGMLILVAMASTFTSEQTLSQGQFRRSLGTPMVKPAPPGRKPVFYECTGNRVLPIDLDFIWPDILRIFPLNQLNPQVVQELNAQKKANEYHEFEFQDNFNNVVKLTCKPRAGKVGFSLAEFKGKEKESEFAAHLDRWNAQEKIVTFLVRPDSFEVFRQARDAARDKGFLISWDPAPPEKLFLRYYGFGLMGGDQNIDH